MLRWSHDFDVAEMSVGCSGGDGGVDFEGFDGGEGTAAGAATLEDSGGLSGNGAWGVEVEMDFEGC